MRNACEQQQNMWKNISKNIKKKDCCSCGNPFIVALKQILGCLGPYSGFQIATVVWNLFLIRASSFEFFNILLFKKLFHLSKTTHNQDFSPYDT